MTTVVRGLQATEADDSPALYAARLLLDRTLPGVQHLVDDDADIKCLMHTHGEVMSTRPVVRHANGKRLNRG